MKDMNPSVIGKLLSELSWEGRKVARYRDNGVGFENVLTAEVFQSLDYLPRVHFLGTILNEIHGSEGILRTKEKIIKEVEELKFIFMPGNYYLRPSMNSHQEGMAVQPDGILESENALILVEAKKPKGASFQHFQLAKEFALLLKKCGNKIPLLLLVIGEEPPIKVDGQGRKSIKKAILDDLPTIVKKAEDFPYELDDVVQMVDNNVGWITWNEIASITNLQMRNLVTESLSIYSCIGRLAKSLTYSIIRHNIIDKK